MREMRNHKCRIFIGGVHLFQTSFGFQYSRNSHMALCYRGGSVGAVEDDKVKLDFLQVFPSFVGENTGIVHIYSKVLPAFEKM